MTTFVHVPSYRYSFDDVLRYTSLPSNSGAVEKVTPAQPPLDTYPKTPAESLTLSEHIIRERSALQKRMERERGWFE